MDVNLFTAILSVGLAVFNLFNFMQHGGGFSLVLCGLWLLFAYRSYRRYKANKD